MNKIKIACIADIHFGIHSTKKLYEELDTIFISYISNNDIDIVFICGDLFDAKLYVNSSNTKLATAFWMKLMRVCTRKDIKVRVVGGTLSHDNDQVPLLETISQDFPVDLKYYPQVSTEEIFPDFKVLYLPEEYVSNGAEYYKEYLGDNKYDMIVGHGLLKEVGFCALKQESEKSISSAYMFDTNELIKCCYGPIVFGHIHEHQLIKSYAFYCGSFSRWSYCEEGDKGFLVFDYNTSKKTFDYEFIINTLATKYDTMEIKCINKNNEQEDILFKRILDEIKMLVDGLEYDNLRLKFYILDGIKNIGLLTSLITATFGKYKNVKIVIENKIQKNMEKDLNEKLTILMDRYGFIFDKNMPRANTVSKYIETRYKENISVEDILKYTTKI